LFGCSNVSLAHRSLGLLGLPSDFEATGLSGLDLVIRRRSGAFGDHGERAIEDFRSSPEPNGFV
jgi:hypothetical protein